jgi:hypothetical protein
MKTRLIRESIDNHNSIFSLKAKYIKNIFDTDGNDIKFNYNIKNEKITVFSDTDAIYVLYS